MATEWGGPTLLDSPRGRVKVDSGQFSEARLADRSRRMAFRNSANWPNFAANRLLVREFVLKNLPEPLITLYAHQPSQFAELPRKSRIPKGSACRFGWLQSHGMAEALQTANQSTLQPFRV